jgi:pimeloyl-ACP methyl ester carboxylesterase
MATYVLIPGAGSDSWFWHLVTPKLEALGHDVVAPDLPLADESAGFAEYADVVADAIGDRSDLIVVAQSMAGFTAPLVCDRRPVDLLVLLAAMVPAPGETAGAWWDNTGQGPAKRAQAERDGRGTGEDDDVVTVFFHDVPDDVTAAAMARGESPQSEHSFEDPWPRESWPDVPTRFLLCRDDRLFPADFQRRVVRERLGIVPDEIDGGHCVALARPDELVARLEAYRVDAGL